MCVQHGYVNNCLHRVNCAVSSHYGLCLATHVTACDVHVTCLIELYNNVAHGKVRMHDCVLHLVLSITIHTDNMWGH